MYPEDSLQSLISPDKWWIENKTGKICRGALVFSFVPHVDQQPYAFKPIGRTNPRSHDKAEIEVSPISVNQKLETTPLPVAAMTTHKNEIWAAYRAKKRPCLVIGYENQAVDKRLVQGKSNSATSPTYLVAPFFGVKEGVRAGYSPEFVERVRHCEYSQFHWDILPHVGGIESILRLDQIQPIGAHYKSHQISNFMLSPTAMDLLDDLIRWKIWGGLVDTSLIFDYRNAIEDMF